MGTSAWLEMENAFAYEGQRMRVAQLIDGTEQNAEWTIPAHNQFALELDHFATCIRSGQTPRTPGEEGLQDQIIIDAIYAAAREGRPVKLERIVKRDAFRGAEPEATD